jgi:hypothetical protein
MGGSGAYLSPGDLGTSPRDAQAIDLGGPVELKLCARRHQNLADIVALLKLLDEAGYLDLEATVERSFRPALARL